MTARGGIKIFISLLGVCLMVALWHSGATLDGRGGWYLLGMLMAVSGALPREVAVGAAVCCVVLLGNGAFRPATSLFGLTWVHGLFCAGLAVGNYLLAQESEVRVLRCAACYWRGPSTQVRFGRCPKCGSHKLKDENRTVIIHA